MKRLVVIPDTHHGHRLGVVPPRWQEKSGPVARVQRELYSALEEALDALAPIDIAVLLGDLVDGPGTRSKATELIHAQPEDQHKQDDISVQLDMACEFIKRIGAKQVEVVCGTPYHVGDGLLLEAIVADRVGARFHYDLILNVIPDGEKEGVRFNFKHHVPTSQVWQSQATGVLRAQQWDMTTSAIENDGLKADVVVRAHAHRYSATDNDAGLAVVSPGLQVASRFGTLRLEGRPTVGFLCFDVRGRLPDGLPDYDLRPQKFRLQSARRMEFIV